MNSMDRSFFCARRFRRIPSIPTSPGSAWFAGGVKARISYNGASDAETPRRLGSLAVNVGVLPSCNFGHFTSRLSTGVLSQDFLNPVVLFRAMPAFRPQSISLPGNEVLEVLHLGQQTARIG